MAALKIDHVDTSGQAEAFARRIASCEVKTYFLQGRWGSGKSEYLHAVAESAPLKGFRFVELRLWQPKDKSSLARKIFSATRPVLSKTSTIIGWVFIVLSMLGSIVLAIQGFIPVCRTGTALLLPITAVAVILTTLYGFLQSSKWLDIDRLLIRISSKTLTSTKKPRVLIIDDFDRLDDETQKELYMFFNRIHGRTRIIFVGDLRKLKNTEDNYLGKIIDQKIALPFQLESSNIAWRTTEAIKTYIKTHIKPEMRTDFDTSMIEKLFRGDSLVARDANQYLSYVQSEFTGQGKMGKVQTDQELFIIYLYLFHSDEYRKLAGGWTPPKENEQNGPQQEKGNDAGKGTPLATTYMDSVLRQNRNNPPDFCKNTSAYFVNEFATNHSLVELNDTLRSSDMSRRFFPFDESSSSTLTSTDYEEMLDYIRNMKDGEYRNVQEILERDAVSTMHSEIRHVPNRLVKLVFTRRMELIEQALIHSPNANDEELDEIMLKEFEGIFDNAQEDLSAPIGPAERMYYYRTCINLRGTLIPSGNSLGRAIPAINENNVSAYFSDNAKEIEEEEDFGRHDYDAESLIVQLGYRYGLDGLVNPALNPGLQSKIESIEKLDPQEYRAFWDAYDIRPVSVEGKPDKLQGGAAFDFNYHDQPYNKHILAKLNNR